MQREHYYDLYGRQAVFDPKVVDCIPQHVVRDDLGVTPTHEEIHRAVGKLNLTSPGNTGANACAYKALLGHDGCMGMVVDFVLEFWESEEAPVEWEMGLLKILPKSGDLSQPGNHRGIMLLEVGYKVVANIIKFRTNPILESLDHERIAVRVPFRARVQRCFVCPAHVGQEEARTWHGDVDYAARLGKGLRQGPEGAAVVGVA